MEFTIDLKNYKNEHTIWKRKAARAIIKSAEGYLLIYSRYGDCKFPGGGVKRGESLEDALVREVQEETGYHVRRDSIKTYGKVMEIRKGDKSSGPIEEVLEMESLYFLCEVEPEAGERKLDAYEKEYNYRVIWMTLEQAIEKNRQVAAIDACPWVIRETRVMELLRDKMK